MTDEQKHRNAVEYAKIAAGIAPTVGLPVRALVAQWALESGWGGSKSGDLNYWGITYNPSRHSGKKWCVTHESLTQAQIDGWPNADEKATIQKLKLVSPGLWRCRMSRWFASFRSVDEAVEEYARVLGLKRYEPAREAAKKYPGNMRMIGEALKDAGYATSERYGEQFAATANGARLQRALDEAGV